MKKFLFIILPGFICLLISCSSKKESSNCISDKTRKNLEAFHYVSDAFISGDISKIDSGVASNFIDHTVQGDLDVAGFKARIIAMTKGVPDMKATPQKVFADDDFVFAQMIVSGTSSGHPFALHYIHVAKFKDAKVVEHWQYQDLAADEPTKTPTLPPAKDSINKGGGASGG
jgi:predicted ester cyclase